MEIQGLYQLAVVDDDGTVDIRQVEMGPRVDNEWIVESGLEASTLGGDGERIARPRSKVGTLGTPDEVARAVVRAARTGRRRLILTPVGKTSALLSRGGLAAVTAGSALSASISASTSSWETSAPRRRSRRS